MDITGVLNNYLKDLTGWSIGFRIILATVFGGCIGINRFRHGRAAGLRTHMLVCLGSAITVMTGLYVIGELGFAGDPTRIAAQVISGIGFLGAGTILNRNGSKIIGLTTAAGLWATASLGIAIGSGFYLCAILAFAVIMITITVLCHFERSLERQRAQFYDLEIADVGAIDCMMESFRESLASVEIHEAKSGIPGHVGLMCAFSGKITQPVLLEKIRSLEYVCFAIPMEWKTDG